MVRAPCCEKMGLKKGPWTPEEDQILVSHIHRYGHPNWRALPKLAGLLRCGKSCRLRWTNYLSPDIKRGNFSTEEEEMIISLHAMLGNRWSAIAARLPGRTDNEIKNVWHTHIKKRVEPKAPSKEKARIKSKPVIMQNSSNTMQSSFGTGTGSVSPERSYSEISYSGTESSSVRENHNRNLSKNGYMESSSQELLDIHENFWNEAFSLENNGTQMVTNSGPKCPQTFGEELSSGCFLSNDEEIDYWLKIFMEAGDILQDFPQL